MVGRANIRRAGLPSAVVGWGWLVAGVILNLAVSSGCTDSTLSNEKVLLSLALTSSAPTLAAGEQLTLTVTAKYSDNKEEVLTEGVTFTSSATRIATVEGPVLTALAAGSTTITATKGNIAGTLVISVVGAKLKQIALTPAAPSLAIGQKLQLTATGTYSDNSQKNITEQVTWSTSASNIAQIDSAGKATAVAIGSASLAASLTEVSQQVVITVNAAVLTSLVINPNTLSLLAGDTSQLQAIGTYSDGVVTDLTNSVSWTLSDDAVGSIVGTGLSRGLLTTTGAGQATIAAASGSINAFSQITVTAPQLVCVVPFYQNNPVFDVFLTAEEAGQLPVPKFLLNGYESSCQALRCPPGQPCAISCPPLAGAGCDPNDSTRPAVWRAWQGTNRSITSGADQTKACDPNNDSRIDFLESPDACLGYAVGSSIAGGSNGEIEPVLNPNCRDPNGVFVGGQPGCPPTYQSDDPTFYSGGCTISACFNNKIATFNVTIRQLIGREIVTFVNEQEPVDITVGGTLPLKVVARYEDDPSAAVEISDCDWSGSDDAIGEVITRSSLFADLNGVDEGTVTVEADCNGAIVTKEIAVRTLDSLEIVFRDTPLAPLTMNVDQSSELAARAYYADDPLTAVDISERCTWSSSNPNIAIVYTQSSPRGSINTLAEGTTQIEAVCFEDDPLGTHTVTLTVEIP